MMQGQERRLPVGIQSEFFDKDGEKLVPTGGTLGKVAKLSMEGGCG